MEIALLALLIVLNGFFAMSEISLVSAKRARLQSYIDAGDRSARLAVTLGSEPTRFLSTVQIGITSVAMLSGIVGEATLAPPVAQQLVLWGLDASTADYVSTAIVVALITYFSIVIGELVPKRFGQLHAEGVARFVALPIHGLSIVSRPFVWLLSRSTEVILRLLRIDESKARQVTEAEIDAVLDEGSAAGVIEEQEKHMVRNLFRLDDRAITSMMTPRSELAYLSLQDTPAQVLATLETEPHSRYPVVRAEVDEIVGVVSARALLLDALRGKQPNLEQLLEPSITVPAHISGMDLLEHFRSSSTNMAFVVDEYGSLLGIVTLHDVLEAIAGELAVAPEERSAIRREDGSLLLDGQIAIADVIDTLGVKISTEDLDGVQTVAGLIMEQLGRVARTGDKLEWQGWRFEVMDMDGHRIDKVLAMRAPKTQSPDS
jgi:putative hemolysin